MSLVGFAARHTPVSMEVVFAGVVGFAEVFGFLLVVHPMNGGGSLHVSKAMEVGRCTLRVLPELRGASPSYSSSNGRGARPSCC